MGGKASSSYVSSPRMAGHSKMINDQQIFNQRLERIIDQVNQFVEKQKIEQELVQYLIERINNWFDEHQKQKKGNLGVKIFEKVQRNFKKDKQFKFSELADQTKLEALLKKFQQEFRTAEDLSKIISNIPKSKKQRKKFYTGNSIRKDQLPIRLDLDDPKQTLIVYQKIVGVLYLGVLSKELTIQDQQLHNFISNFHYQYGVMVMRFVLCEKLNSSELLFIIYRLLLITSSRIKNEKERIQMIKQNMNQITQRFVKRFKDQENIYMLPEKDVQNIRELSNCYLKELYQKGLVEIDNPFIEEESESAVKCLFIFPTNTVKYKNNKKY